VSVENVSEADADPGREIQPAGQPVERVWAGLKRHILLSERQRQLLHGRARGLTYAQIAKQLFVSESTLRGYWLDLTRSLSDSLRSLTPSEIERALGLAPGDLLEFWSGEATDVKDWWRADTGR